MTYIMIIVHNQWSCNKVQTQGPCKAHTVIIVQNQKSCNIVQTKGCAILICRAQVKDIYVSFSSLIYHMWWPSALRVLLSNSLWYSVSNPVVTIFDQNIWCSSRVMSIFTTLP